MRIALVIAAPLSWHLMQRRLEDYTYKINVTWDVFAVAGVISLFCLDHGQLSIDPHW